MHGIDRPLFYCAGPRREPRQHGGKECQRAVPFSLRKGRRVLTSPLHRSNLGTATQNIGSAKKEAEKGISPQLMFLTMLSMNLAILNFLPIPALDGGHMVFLIYELVAGKRANEQLEFRLTLAGVLALLLLMVVVFANDILRHLLNAFSPPLVVSGSRAVGHETVSRRL